jgi:hypothetical protein
MDTADRFEVKMLLNPVQRAGLGEAFGDRLKPDTEASPNGEYPIVTLYFDTPDHRSFWDSWRGVGSRRKLRVRVYGSSDGRISPAVFIEVKHKVDGRGVKRRLRMGFETAGALVAGNDGPFRREFGEHRVGQEILGMIGEERYTPFCVMRYFRRAYFLEGSEAFPGGEPVRMTFDEGLAVRFSLLELCPDDVRFQRNLLEEGMQIMEVKGFGAVPYPVTQVFSALGLSPGRFSKFRSAFEDFRENGGSGI